ncbi:hypothetical protein F400_gp118 [Bacillus phage BCD7]|uniref:Uncharacterized protein n=1 Tax=Bacillus phage BCD7 TaxID=1136534 RepID=J9PVD0_9CAUD|nr:hypothetical protein F400_gp118 [Bacillus phage BCD7]AEZ50565.1 hypothetical protein BCD7_0118 [Bacillus phage BCD7]
MVKKSAKKEPEKKLDSISAIDEELKSLEVHEGIAKKELEQKRREAKEAEDRKKELANKKTQLRRKKQALEIDEFKRNMYEELGINPLTPLVEDFYIIAWEDGHSYGMHEVKNHMIDYVDILAKIERVNNSVNEIHNILSLEKLRVKDETGVKVIRELVSHVEAIRKAWSEKS